MPTAAVNGIDIYYELHGEGPPLMYISGTGNDLRRSPASILPVNRWFETLSYDQRGLGRTSKPGGDHSMADYADDAAALVRSMGWEHCHVMGVSFGGMVALDLAQRHPEQLAGLGRQLRARAGHDVLDALASIEQTTLECAGEYDGIAPVANSVVLADRLPNATLRVFDGGHGFLVQDRTAFPEMIDFLRSES